MKAALLVCALAASATAEPLKVGPGVYRPIFPAQPSEREVRVPAFMLDETPVTNAQFHAFTQAHPEWQRIQKDPRWVAEGGITTVTSSVLLNPLPFSQVR